MAACWVGSGDSAFAIPHSISAIAMTGRNTGLPPTAASLAETIGHWRLPGHAKREMTLVFQQVSVHRRHHPTFSRAAVNSGSLIFGKVCRKKSALHLAYSGEITIHKGKFGVKSRS